MPLKSRGMGWTRMCMRVTCSRLRQIYGWKRRRRFNRWTLGRSLGMMLRWCFGWRTWRVSGGPKVLRFWLGIQRGILLKRNGQGKRSRRSWGSVLVKVVMVGLGRDRWRRTLRTIRLFWEVCVLLSLLHFCLLCLIWYRNWPRLGSFKSPPPGQPRSQVPQNPDLKLGQKVQDLHDPVARKNFRVVVVRPEVVEQLDVSDYEHPQRRMWTLIEDGKQPGRWEEVELWPWNAYEWLFGFGCYPCG